MWTRPCMSCSRRGPLRHVCGQTIYTTAMICTFLESLTDLDVHPGKRFALFWWNRRNWRRRSRHPKLRNLLDVTRTDEVWVLPMTIFFVHFNFLVCSALFFFPSRAQIWRNRAKYRVCLFLCLDTGGMHCVTFAATPITAQLWFIYFWKAPVT